MTISLVTGGSGFVGRALIAELVHRAQAAGDPKGSVRALARSDQAARTVEQLGATVVRGDLEDDAALSAGMRGADWLFHAAAKVEDWGDPEDFERVNVQGTRRVLELAREAGVKRAVHVGTEAVLVGGGPILNVDERRHLPLENIGQYPASKAAAERVALAQSRDGLDVMVIRPRLIWGRDDTSVLRQIVEAVDKKQFAWIGGGRYLTSTCHVENVVEGAILAAERGAAGEVYFLTDGPPVEFREFVEELLDTQGRPAPRRSVPRPLAHAVASLGELVWRRMRLSGAPPLTRGAVRLIGEEVTVNDAKARRDLGYSAHKTRQSGMAELRAAGPMVAPPA